MSSTSNFIIIVTRDEKLEHVTQWFYQARPFKCFTKTSSRDKTNRIFFLPAARTKKQSVDADGIEELMQNHHLLPAFLRISCVKTKAVENIDWHVPVWIRYFHPRTLFSDLGYSKKFDDQLSVRTKLFPIRFGSSVRHYWTNFLGIGVFRE